MEGGGEGDEGGGRSNFAGMGECQCAAWVCGIGVKQVRRRGGEGAGRGELIFYLSRVPEKKNKKKTGVAFSDILS